MFDIGFSELLVIGIVALIVVGPKDLPGMFHTLGRFTARARQLGREFSRAMEAAAKEAGVDDVAKDLKSATSAKSLGLDALKGAADKFEKWSPNDSAKPAPKAALSPERAEMAKKINEASAAKAQARLDAEAAKKAEDWELADAEPEPETKPAPKPAAKKAPPRKPVVKKPATKKPAAKKTAANKPVAKKTPAKKPAAAPDSDA